MPCGRAHVNQGIQSLLERSEAGAEPSEDGAETCADEAERENKRRRWGGGEESIDNQQVTK